VDLWSAIEVLGMKMTYSFRGIIGMDSMVATQIVVNYFKLLEATNSYRRSDWQRLDVKICSDRPYMHQLN
jgi:hypothetical protein